MDELKGIMVPIPEVNVVEGQYERSVDGAIMNENESVIYEMEVKDSIDDEMLQSIDVCSLPMGTYDVPFLDDSSDLGSLMKHRANGFRDGDLATADLQPGHLLTNQIDRRMMTVHELEHARNTRGTRWGSSPDAWFVGEPRMGRRLTGVKPSA